MLSRVNEAPVAPSWKRTENEILYRGWGTPERHRVEGDPWRWRRAEALRTDTHRAPVCWPVTPAQGDCGPGHAAWSAGEPTPAGTPVPVLARGRPGVRARSHRLALAPPAARPEEAPRVSRCQPGRRPRGAQLERRPGTEAESAARAGSPPRQAAPAPPCAGDPAPARPDPGLALQPPAPGSGPDPPVPAPAPTARLDGRPGTRAAHSPRGPHGRAGGRAPFIGLGFVRPRPLPRRRRSRRTLHPSQGPARPGRGRGRGRRAQAQCPHARLSPGPGRTGGSRCRGAAEGAIPQASPRPQGWVGPTAQAQSRPRAGVGRLRRRNLPRAP